MESCSFKLKKSMSKISHDAPKTYSDGPSRCTKSTSNVGDYRGMTMGFQVKLKFMVEVLFQPPS